MTSLTKNRRKKWFWNQKIFGLHQRLGTQSNHVYLYLQKWPWSTWYIPKKNLTSKSTFLALYQWQVNIKYMSSPRNNKQRWSIWQKLKEKIDFKIKKPFFWVKRRVTTNNMSKLRNNKLPERAWHKLKRNLFLKSKNLLSASKARHHKEHV